MNSSISAIENDALSALEEFDVWNQLELYLNQLQLAQDVSKQLRATLEMIRGTVRCDHVLLFSSQNREVMDRVGTGTFRQADVASLLQNALEHVRPEEQQFALSQPKPIAMVRLSSSRGVWLAAVRDSSSRRFSARDLQIMSLCRRLLQQQQSQARSQDRLRDVMFSLVRCLTAALDARDPYTWGHSERVARIAVCLAEQLGLPHEKRSELYLGGLLHDIGKIGVPDQVLRKPERLTEDEMRLVKEHVLVGEAIVSHVRQFSQLREMVRHHHEQVDGKGYPDGLIGEQIPLLARLLAVADAFDAMSSDRPYRAALPLERIEAIFRDGSGRQWDAAVVEALLARKCEVVSICQRGLGDSVLQAVDQALNAGAGVADVMRSFLGTGLRPELPR